MSNDVAGNNKNIRQTDGHIHKKRSESELKENLSITEADSMHRKWYIEGIFDEKPLIGIIQRKDS